MKWAGIVDQTITRSFQVNEGVKLNSAKKCNWKSVVNCKNEINESDKQYNSKGNLWEAIKTTMLEIELKVKKMNKISG